jgi:hypothetical protein
MSTYAYWRLWVGARIESIDSINAPQKTLEILDQLKEGTFEIEGLKLTQIYMHGEAVGIGVEVYELGWNTKLDGDNVFDNTKIIEANALVPKLSKIFMDLGLLTWTSVYHHLNLGG